MARMSQRDRALAVHEILTREFPLIPSLLNYRNPFELVVAVILSAQTTDAAVNRTTPELFRRFPEPGALASAPPEELESLVRPLGFFRIKARNIRLASEVLVREFAGRVPEEMEDLLRIPGVGRKSANVLLFHIHGKPAVIVDTHFGRVVRRLGLTAARDPGMVETELAAMLPEEVRSSFSMRINLHGRKTCVARKPACYRCSVEKLCLYEAKTPLPG